MREEEGKKWVSEVCAVKGASRNSGKRITGKWWTLSEHQQQNTWLILLKGVCFARCVLYTIFLHYLTHLSLCQPLGIALQSVIYVYWSPCGQEVGSKFTQVIRPLDKSRAGGEKHISFLNGVFSLLGPKVFPHICFILKPIFSETFYLISWCHWGNIQTVEPLGLQVWAKSVQ